MARYTPGPDPAFEFLASLGSPTVPVVHDPDCYICADPDFARAGLPLCYPCAECGAHIAADDGNRLCEDCRD